MRLWSLPDGKHLRTLTGHRNEELDSVLCLAIDPAGRWLASGATDETIRVYNLPTGGHLCTLADHRGPVTCLLFSPDGETLISGSSDQTLRFWSIPDGDMEEAVDVHAGEVAEVAASVDGALLLTRSSPGLAHDHLLRMWDATGRLRRCLSGHDGAVNDMVLSADGSLLASGSSDRTVRLWSAELPRLIDLPPGRATLADLEWLETAARDRSLSGHERTAVQFVAGLFRRYKRGDIVVEDGEARESQAPVPETAHTPRRKNQG